MYYICNKDEKTQKKFSNAIQHYAMLYPGEYPIICYDNTILGSADSGLVATTHGIYIKNNNKNNYIYLRYEEIQSIEYNDKMILGEIIINGKYEVKPILDKIVRNILSAIKELVDQTRVSHQALKL